MPPYIRSMDLMVIFCGWQQSTALLKRRIFGIIKTAARQEKDVVRYPSLPKPHPYTTDPVSPALPHPNPSLPSGLLLA